MINTDIAPKLEELPWLNQPWQQLCHYLQSGKLPQALLLTGPEGVGKQILARAFVRRLLCNQPADDAACGICPSCKLYDAGNHPDAITVAPEEAGKSILIDQVRGLIAKLSLKPQYGTYRVVTIVPADKLNRAAANSLLKTLEEPEARTLLLLLTHNPAVLPATIRSRCQFLIVDSPERSQTLGWLKPMLDDATQADMLLIMAGGSPFRALELARSDLPLARLRFFKSWQALLLKKADPLQTAEQWQKTAGETLLAWLASWTIDLVRLAQTSDAVFVENHDLLADLNVLASRLNAKKLFKFYDQLGVSLQALAGQANRQLILEEVLILSTSLD